MTDTMTIGQRAVSFIENTFTQKATVMAVRAWEPATFYEVDVLMPETDNMSDWRRPQKIFACVAPLTYREYTPAGWDSDIRTCTLYIDAGHDGAGSRWVRQLKAGDTFTFVRASVAHYAPDHDRPAVFLGDLSAIAHFAALSQIGGSDMSVSGAIVLEEQGHQGLYGQYMPSLPLEPLYVETTPLEAVYSWMLTRIFPAGATFYLMGNRDLVKGLHHALKEKGIDSGRITAKGFWK